LVAVGTGVKMIRGEALHALPRSRSIMIEDMNVLHAE